MILKQLGVEPEDILVLEQSLFEDPDIIAMTGEIDEDAMRSDDADDSKDVPPPQSLSHAVFMETALRLRSGNSARVQDVAELRALITRSIEDLSAQVTRQLEQAMQELRTGASVDEAPGGQRNTEALLSSLPSAVLRGCLRKRALDARGTPNAFHEQGAGFGDREACHDTPGAVLTTKASASLVPDQAWLLPHAPSTESATWNGATGQPPPRAASVSTIESSPASILEDCGLEVERMLLAGFQTMHDEFRGLRDQVLKQKAPTAVEPQSPPAT